MDNEGKVMEEAISTKLPQKALSFNPFEPGNLETINYIDKRPTAVEHINFSGRYSKNLIKSIVAVAKEEGVDPYEILASGLQETRLGNTTGYQPRKDSTYTMNQTSPWSAGISSGNIFFSQTDLTPEIEKKLSAKQQEEYEKLGFNDSYKRANIRRAIELLKQKELYAKKLYNKFRGRDPNRAEILQGLQGYGKIPHSEYQSYFGEKRELHGFRDIPHGKRLLEHIESLKKNKHIRKIVEDMLFGEK